MCIQRVSLGIKAIFLGMLLPVLHHLTLCFAIDYEGYGGINRFSMMMLRAVPWVYWVYLAIMLVIGIALLISGFISKEN
jgi:hypothetical protein